MGKKKKIIIMKLVVLLVLFVGFIGCSKQDKVSNNSIFVTAKTTNNTYQGVTFNNERTISFLFTYTDKENMEIEITPGGASRLPNIGSFYLVNINDINDRKIYLETFSDWLMPYKVYAKNNSTNTRKENEKIWTGGWHGANGSTFDLPSSGINIRFDLYIDGKKIEGNINEAIECEEATIIIENLICAYNTVDLNAGYNGNSRAVLKETQTLTLRSGDIEVNNEIEALEDIAIKTAYGIAMNINNMSTDSTIKYIGTNDESEKAAIVEGGEVYIHDSGFKSDKNKCSSIVAENKLTGDVLEAYINNDIGIGNYEYISDDTPMAFTSNYKKAYYNLVNGKDLSMNKGEKVSFTGGWRIYNKLYSIKGKNFN